MKRFLAALLVAFALPAAAWTPPTDPDPDKILRDAVDDRMAGRYEDALAKQLWFHHEALRYRRSLANVRLSYALAYWADLAELYAPAKAALLKTRDDAAQAVRENRSAEDNFEDLVAIDRELDDPVDTVSVFLEVEKRDPKRAKELAARAIDALIDAKYYDVAARNVDVERQMKVATNTYEEMKAHAPPVKGIDFAALNEVFYSARVGRLVAMLVLANRKADAEKLAQEALAVSSSEKVKATLDAALQGQVPPPFIDPKARRAARLAAPTAASPAAPK